MIGRADIEVVERGREFGGLLYGGQARLYAEVLSRGRLGAPARFDSVREFSHGAL
jgi:hypothetical protein